MHQFRVAISSVLLAYVFTADAMAEQSALSGAQNCDSALSDISARQAMPSLTSPAVREAVCNCLKAALPALEDSSSGPPSDDTMQSVVAQCTSRIVPVERIVNLPIAVIGKLQDSTSSASTPKAFLNAKANLGACKMPEYPAASLRVEAYGDTKLAFKISESGRVYDGIVIGSAGASAQHKLLDVMALFSLMQCKFEPASWRKIPIESWTEVEYRWRIN